MDWDTSPKFGLQVDFDLSKLTESPKTKLEVELRCCVRRLGYRVWCHNSFTDGLICMKFGRQMQNEMPWLHKLENRNQKYNSNMADVCVQKPEVVISQQWIEICPKFGMQVYFELPKWTKSWKPKPEVELRCRGRHLEKWIWHHNCVGDGPIWTKFDR